MNPQDKVQPLSTQSAQRRRERRENMKRKLAGMVFGLLLVAGCAAPKPVQERALYDLGRSATDASAASSAPPMRVVASLPAWLDTGDIAYRLAYEDASRLRHFSGSRWAGRPSQLLSARLVARLSTHMSGGKARCTLQLEVEEFAQHFASTSASSFEITGRWQIAGSAGERLAGGSIRLSEPAGADAPAGVKAATRLVDRLADELSAAAGKLTACAT